MKKQNILKIIASALSVCVIAAAAPTTVSAAHSFADSTELAGAAKPHENGNKMSEPGAVQSDGFSDEGYIEGGALGSGRLEIDNSITEKTHYTIGEGSIYFAPAEEGGSAFLRLENIPFLENSGFEISYEIEAPITIEAEGVNAEVYLLLEYDVDITLTGSGELNNFFFRASPAKINTDSFTGKLNAMIYTENIDVEIPRVDYTIYGEYVFTLGPEFAIGNFDNFAVTLTIPAGASFTVPEKCILEMCGTGNGSTDFLNIEGSLVNNGTIIFSEAAPEDPSAFIEGLGLSGSGFVIISTASGNGDDEIDDSNSEIYSNNGYLYGGDIENGVTIDENTVKTFYIDGLTNNPIFYTPPEGENPAMLEVYGIGNSKAHFDCYVDIPVILYIEGDNSFDFNWLSDVLLTGPGSFTGVIATKEFYIGEDFEGELNAKVQEHEITATDAGYDITVYNVIYGSYVQTEPYETLAGEMEGNESGLTYRSLVTLTVTKDSAYIIDEYCTAEISNAGNNYEEYLKIDGEIVNDGAIVCSGEIPDDRAAFIRSLKLRGSGTVQFEYEDEDGIPKTDIYTNDGVKLSYNEGELDFKDNKDVWGDHLSEYGYSFEEKDGSYVLTLTDFSTPDMVTLPSDKPIVINSAGSCYIGELSIAEKSDREIILTFEGDGELTVNKSLQLDRGILKMTVAERASLTTNNEITAYEGVGQITVNGSYTAICGAGNYEEAVLVDCIKIGPKGIMNVKGRRGVCLYRDNGADYPSFAIEEGGRFIADCGEYGLAICTNDGIDSIVSIPEGYLPHGYEFVRAADETTGGYCMILTLEGSEITFRSYMREIVSGEGAEGYIVIHGHSEDYDKFIPDPDNPDQHIKSCSNEPNHSDSAAPHAFGGYEYADEPEHEGEHKHTCEECGYTAYEKCSGGTADCTTGKICDKCGEEYTEPLGHDFGDWTPTGGGEHKRECVHDGCGVAESGKCDWGEWEEVKAPTETETGLKTRECKICSGTDSEVIPVVDPDDPKDPIDPDDPKDPVDPDDPKDPVDPDDPKDPVDPDDPKDPVDPDDPKDPVDPDDPKEPVDPDDPKPTDPDKDMTLTDNETGISVSGAIPEGAELLVTFDTENSTASRLYFDISLVKDGQKCQPEGKVTVKIPVPEAMKEIAETLKVYHFADEKYTNMNARLENGYLVFETDHFSVYVVTADVISEGGGNNGDNTDEQEPKPVTKPDTGDFIIPETTTAAASADTTSAPQPTETSAPAETAEAGGATSAESTAAPVPDNGSTEQPISADIADNGIENTGDSYAANGNTAENNPNTGLGMAILPVFIAAASVSLIIYNKKK